MTIVLYFFYSYFEYTTTWHIEDMRMYSLNMA